MNPTASFQFTIIVPVYNEREGLLRLENSLQEGLPAATREKLSRRATTS